MRNEIRRLGSRIASAVVVALVLFAAVPDASAQTRGRESRQESRESGRKATAKSNSRSSERKASSAGKNESSSKATNSRSSSRSKATTSSSRNSGKSSSDRAVTRTKNEGSRATNRENGERGTRKSRATRTTNRDARATGRVESGRKDARVDRTRVTPRPKRVAKQSVRYHRPVNKSNRWYRYDRRHKRYVHVSSHIYIGSRWPWRVRFERHWRPRYRYRQVVYVNVGWGSNRRAERVDVSTTYRQRVIAANDDYAEVEIDIESIDIHQGGRYVGYVDRIPSRVSKVRAKIWSDGAIEFDRNVFIVGDRYSGFDIVATQYYDDYLLNAYRKGDRFDVARVDIRNHRARNVRSSRAFDPYNFSGNVPISLLPDDDRLWDYGNDVMSQYDSSRYRRDLSVDYRTGNGLDVEMRGETFLERVD